MLVDTLLQLFSSRMRPTASPLSPPLLQQDATSFKVAARFTAPHAGERGILPPTNAEDVAKAIGRATHAQHLQVAIAFHVR